ncbi:ESPR-type extended signal peptide-containing protein [Paraburkholderia bonniea]|uniref:ESPR-type extended signal peptide-containing protein n=1 Tax=Paraburkholderia bonniea TaxID=2152891 RepID=UPI0025738376|nr:ESPR-type extended signal peptide-containing protein [Paraburkholderia bonniea]WJF90752.1 ESPR-type extended signal peptide-containing protein [Paraburkholderia bonniea]WJF94066.1 ESPR-type extended signal peptide-containing protein [Paraburkholderia bonniea]
MNKIYRIVWNATTQSWSVASELVRGRSKGSNNKKILALLALAGAANLVSLNAIAAPALTSGTDNLNTAIIKPACSTLTATERLAGPGKDCESGEEIVKPGLELASIRSAAPKELGPTLRAAPLDYLAINGKGDGSDKASAAGTSAAIGASANAEGPTSVAIGYNAKSGGGGGGEGSIAIGESATTIAGAGVARIAIGRNAKAGVIGSTGSIAVGGDASSTGNRSLALGYSSTANNAHAISIGSYAGASGSESLAIGTGSSASGDTASALGKNAKATHANAVSLGSTSETDRGDSVSVGNATTQRQITRMAKGTADTDAVNVSQLKGIATALGGGAEVNADGSIKAPNYTIQGTSYTSIGDAFTKLDGATTTNTTNITNLDAKVSSITSGTIGLVQQDPTSKTITVASATDGRLINLAGTAGPRVLSGIANGTGDTDAVSIAQLKSVGVIDPTGKLLTAVVYDDLTLGRVTMGGSYGTVIGNVADGLIAASSKEAINGSQLFTLKQEMEKKFTALDADITNLGDKITNLSGDVTNLNTLVTNKLIDDSKGTTLSPGTGSGSHQIGPGATAAGTNSLAIGPDAKANSNNSVALGPGSVADRDNTISVGSAGNERQITNVAAGTAPTDAVNLNQLNSRFNSAQNAINSVARNAYAGAAAAMAMPNITPSGPGRTVIAAGAANYKSGSATAASITYRSLNSRWLINGAISVTSTGDAAVRTQIGYEF